MISGNIKTANVLYVRSDAGSSAERALHKGDGWGFYNVLEVRRLSSLRWGKAGKPALLPFFFSLIQNYPGLQATNFLPRSPIRKCVTYAKRSPVRGKLLTPDNGFEGFRGS